MDWDHLATDGDKCRAVVSMATDPFIPLKAANFFLSRLWLIASQEDSAP